MRVVSGASVPAGQSGRGGSVNLTGDLFTTTPESRRDLGMARVQRAADDAVASWTERAAAYLRDYARTTHGQPFLVEDAAEVSRLPAPPNAKAWGPAAQLAARMGWIRRAGYAPARSSNRSPKCLWVAECRLERG